ncbi:MAG: SPFH domain-containing protein, partial [Coriobacteriaceae bacterium]|nr:SPFH domain-containing protein [Coriobacteriaceae bacterium]
PAFARISAMGVRYSAVPAHTKELAQALNEELSDTWSDLRGIEVASFGVNTIAASPEDEDMIKQLQKAAVMRDPTMAAANLAAAQSDAMRAAASNEAGAAVGFMGMGMAGAMGGMNGADLYGRGGTDGGAARQSAYQQAPGGGFGGAAGAGVAAGVGAAAGAAGTDGGAGAGGWTCPACGTANTGKFCGECGTPRPVAAQAEWRCPSCGATNTGKFCGECGTPRP